MKGPTALEMDKRASGAGRSSQSDRKFAFRAERLLLHMPVPTCLRSRSVDFESTCACRGSLVRRSMAVRS